MKKFEEVFLIDVCSSTMGRLLVRSGWRREAVQKTRCKSRDKGGRWNVNDHSETSYDVNKR